MPFFANPVTNYGMCNLYWCSLARSPSAIALSMLHANKEICKLTT